MTNIFISYNPKVEAEQSLALRLQTLGALYGLSVSLPDRIGSSELKEVTRERIKKAKIFIVFSTRNLTRFVKEEINYAATIKKKIIVVYDKDVDKNLNLADVIEIEYNQDNDTPEKILKEVSKHVAAVPVKAHKKTQVETKEDNTIIAFLVIAIGLLLLGGLASNKK